MTSPEYSIDVPDQCKDCPVIAVIRGEYDTLQVGQTEMFAAFTNENIAERMEKMMRTVDPEASDESIEAQVPELINDLREITVPVLEEIADRKKELQDRAEALAANCPGCSTMRATDKLGRTVTARFCSSPKNPAGIDPSPEPVYIERSTEQ